MEKELVKKMFCATNPFSKETPYYYNDFESSSFKEALEDYIKVFENEGRIRAIMYRYNGSGCALIENLRKRFPYASVSTTRTETTFLFSYKGDYIYVHVGMQYFSDGLFAICFQY